MDSRKVKNDVISFTETQMKPSKDSKLSFDKNEDTFFSLSHACQDDIAIIRKFYIIGFP